MNDGHLGTDQHSAARPQHPMRRGCKEGAVQSCGEEQTKTGSAAAVGQRAMRDERGTPGLVGRVGVDEMA